jgi:hypothetical protein
MEKNIKGHNIKWFFTEIINLYSTNNSYFSKKRIESGIAFLVGQFGMFYYIIDHISKMNSTDLGIWAAIEFAIAGYITNQIQQQKKLDANIKEDDDTTESEQPKQ